MRKTPFLNLNIMTNLNLKAFGGLLFLSAVMGLAIFLTAWTIDYWQGWVFLAVFSLSALAITVYLMVADPHLLERRVQAGPAAEKEFRQKIIQSLSSFSFFSLIVLPVADHRFGWSVVSVYISVAGDALVATGFYLVYRVFKENTFTSSVIEVMKDQKVIATGPYAVVRHPMYSGALVLLSGVSPALGSWWGLSPIIPFILILAWRLIDEEKFLESHLKGYTEYEKKVKYRLLPLIW
jgi:protein-S-isoprenylcysteine O-methyltransferase Ste14